MILAPATEIDDHLLFLCILSVDRLEIYNKIPFSDRKRERPNYIHDDNRFFIQIKITNYKNNNFKYSHKFRLGHIK